MRGDLFGPAGGGRSRRLMAAAARRVALGAIVLAVAAMAAACGGSGGDPVAMVQKAPFLPDSGASVGKTLAGYAYFADPVWETYVDEQQRTIVRFAAEYDVARAVAQCPSVGGEVKPAARVFVSLVYLLQGDGAVTLLEGVIEAFSATGYSAKYLADQAALSRIPAGQPCVACMALFLPASL